MAEEKKSKSRKPLVIFGIGCVVVVLIALASTGGYYGYTYYYIPQQEQQYKDSHEEEFNSISEMTDDLDKSFSRDDLSLFLADSTEDFANDSSAKIEEINDLKADVEEARNALPGSTPYADDVNNELRSYYDDLETLLTDYVLFLEDSSKLTDSLDKVNNITTTTDLSGLEAGNLEELELGRQQLEQLALDLQELEDDINAITVSDGVSDVRQSILDLVVSFKDFVIIAEDIYSQMLNLPDSATVSDLNIIIEDFEASYTVFIDDISTAEQLEADAIEKAGDSFESSFDSLSDKAKSVSGKFDDLGT